MTSSTTFGIYSPDCRLEGSNSRKKRWNLSGEAPHRRRKICPACRVRGELLIILRGKQLEDGRTLAD
ncbi:hypothetical protein Dimus_019748 [Dionaea muscipula]